MLERIIASLNIYHYVVMGILAGAFIIQLFYYLYFYRRVLGQGRKIKKGKITFSDNLPPVSVVICARNESENLRDFLPDILTQDYPNFEVIVVNDGSSDESAELLARLTEKHPHLYHTYLPAEVKCISTKKMALTVGIKAAKHDILLLTDADCRPSGKDWITSMIRNFDDKTDVVLGYGSYTKGKGILNKMICYDAFMIALQYMGFALAGKPYMGVGRNLAYRKELFFKNKGFASHLGIQSGDDDLFIKEVSNKNNTRVEISPESITHSIPKDSFKAWYNQKLRHLTTSPYYKKGIKGLIGLEVFSRFVFYASLIAILILKNLWVAILGASFFLLRYLVQLLVINRTARKMNEQRFYISVLSFDIFLPLVNFFIMITGKHKKQIVVKWK